MSFATPPPGPRSPAERLGDIIEWLCRAIAAIAAKNPAALPMLLLAWGRLRRLAARFTKLAAHAAAGTIPTHRQHAPRTRPTLAPDPAQPPPPQRPRLPSGRYWLIQLVPEANGFASQLQQLLADPDMAALLQAAPQAGRILRPLCRMLAIRPGPPLALAAAERPPRLPRPEPPLGSPHNGPPRGPRPPSARTALRRLHAISSIPPRWTPA